MNPDMPSSRPDPVKSSTQQDQHRHTTSNPRTEDAARRVGVYDQPNRPSTQTSSTIAMVLLLIALAAIIYYFFFAS